MIYGANGYTGEMVAREAVARGLAPVLAGRSAAPVEALAKELDLPSRVFSLDDDTAAHLEGMDLVLHCAGPFSATSSPMLEACLTGGVHYLDITGEIDVFHHAWRQDERARRADVLVCPGVGFDVVPTDCLAASLVAKLPSATSLVLAFEASGGPSRGTARTSIEQLGRGGRVRKDGELRTVPMAWKTREIPFAHGARMAVTIPWGDVFTAWVSTGVPDVEVYLSMPPAAIRRLRRLRHFSAVLRWGWVQSMLRSKVDARPQGPDETLRERTGVQVWAEARSADGRRVEGTLSGPNGYDVTVSASLGVVEHVLKTDVMGGYTTPSLLMGAGFAGDLPGVSQSVGDVVSD